MATYPECHVSHVCQLMIRVIMKLYRVLCSDLLEFTLRLRKTSAKRSSSDGLFTLIMLGERYKLRRFSLWSLLDSSLFLIFLRGILVVFICVKRLVSPKGCKISTKPILFAPLRIRSSFLLSEIEKPDTERRPAIDLQALALCGLLRLELLFIKC